MDRRVTSGSGGEEDVAAFRSATFAARREEFFPCFRTRLGEESMLFGTTFDGARFHSVGTVAHVVAGDRAELNGGQRTDQGRRGAAEPIPGGGDRLPRAGKTDLPRQFAVHECCLRDALADQIVSQPCRPDFLANHLRAFAPQVVHGQRLLQGAQIELSVPIIIPLKITLLSS